MIEILLISFNLKNNRPKLERKQDWEEEEVGGARGRVLVRVCPQLRQGKEAQSEQMCSGHTR